MSIAGPVPVHCLGRVICGWLPEGRNPTDLLADIFDVRQLRSVIRPSHIPSDNFKLETPPPGPSSDFIIPELDSVSTCPSHLGYPLRPLTFSTAAQPVKSSTPLCVLGLLFPRNCSHSDYFFPSISKSRSDFDSDSQSFTIAGGTIKLTVFYCYVMTVPLHVTATSPPTGFEVTKL